MAGSRLIELADAVVADLNADSFSLPFTAVRKQLVTPNLDELTDDVQLFVVPGVDRSEISGRETTSHEYDIVIGIMQKLTGADDPNFDFLTQLGQEIADYFRFRKFLILKERWKASELVAYVPPALTERNAFFSTVKLTFTGTR